MKPETKFRLSVVIPFLKTLRNSWWESIQQVAISGTPDILLCMRGKFVALELKKDEHTEPEELQKFKLSEIKKHGGIALVVHPKNWQIIKQKLQQLDQGGQR